MLKKGLFIQTNRVYYQLAGSRINNTREGDLMRFYRLLAAVAVVSAMFDVPVALAQAEEAQGTTAYFVEIESYKWQEFFPKNVGIVEESGPRGAIGMAWSNLRTPSGGPVYRAHGKIYGGKVDYDGETLRTTPTPVSTEASYMGLQAEGVGGYRFGGKVGFELVSGIGVDMWMRDIKENSASATPVGYNTLFIVPSAKLGIGMFTRFESFGMALRAGPKMPLFVLERAYLYDNVDFRPIPHPSWFGTAEFSFGGRGKDRFTLSFYYDSYRFGSSEPANLTQEGVLVGTPAQQDVEMSVYGARLAFGF